jgi:hypothetical protein
MAYSESERKYLKNENFGALLGSRKLSAYNPNYPMVHLSSAKKEKFSLTENSSEKLKNEYLNGKKISYSAKNQNLAPQFEKMEKRQINEIHNHNNTCNNYNNNFVVPYTLENPKVDHKFQSPLSSIHLNNLSENSQSNISIISSLGSDIKKNSAEKGLRGYFNRNRAHFLERVCKGPPETFRFVAWMIISGVPFDRCQETYSNLLELDLEPETEIQINKDITRTLRDQDLNSPEIQGMLYRILKAMALLDKELSYCQGMNFISGFLLITSDFDELETLHMLIALFSCNYSEKYNIRNFFTHGFPLLMFYLYAFDLLFAKKIPKLFQHFKSLEIPTQCWISKWFQTLFTHCLNYEAVLRLWDYIILYGLNFIIPFTLSLLKFLENKLLNLHDLVEITEFFKRLNTHQNKISPNLQIDYNIEVILKDAKSKFNISKDEINELLIKQYYPLKQTEFFLCSDSETHIPYIITEKKYNLEKFSNLNKTNEINSVVVSPVNKKKHSINLDYNNYNYNQKILLPYCESKQSSKIVHKCSTEMTIKEGDTNNINSVSDVEDDLNLEIEDDIVTTEVGILDDNKQILEIINKNRIKFENPFLKNLKFINDCENVKNGQD